MGYQVLAIDLNGNWSLGFFTVASNWLPVTAVSRRVNSLELWVSMPEIGRAGEEVWEKRVNFSPASFSLGRRAIVCPLHRIVTSGTRRGDLIRNNEKSRQGL